jgi:hypothetical protein
MKKMCSWLVALTGLFGLASVTYAGSPGLFPQLLPQLFGQDEPRPLARPDDQDPASSEQARDRQYPVQKSTDPWTDDDGWLVDLLESIDLFDACPWTQYVLEPLARMLMPATPVLPPFDLAAEVALRYASAVAAARQDAEDAAADAKDDTSRSCEMLPYPKVVSGPNACPLAYGCPLGCGSAAVGQCTPCPSASPATAKGCGSCPSACWGVPCPTFGEIVSSGAGKPCKCCENCKDCKDCTCGKNAAKNAAYSVHGFVLENAHPWAPVAMPPLPPLMPHPAMFPMLPPPHPGRHETPLGPLVELLWQRELISAAIEQMEEELAQAAQAAQMAQQQRTVYAQMATSTLSAPKVRLSTEHFEAQCAAMRCLGNDPHRLVLEGEVVLTCKKSGHVVRIEAPCVVVNMQDGTFSVDSHVPPPAAPAVPSSVQGLHPLPAPPVMYWTPDMSSRYTPYYGSSWSVPTWQQGPMPYPVVPATYAPTPYTPSPRPASPYSTPEIQGGGFSR